MNLIKHVLCIGLSCFLFVVTSAQQPLFTRLAASQTGIDMVLNLQESPTLNVLLYQYLYNGGGVAAGDVDRNGYCDLFFTGNAGADKLYLNNGNMQFTDATSASGILPPHGWSSGVTMADVNGDGNLDIYVCKSGQFSTRDRHNLLYINKGNGTFEEKAKLFGLDDSSFSTQAVFFDMDKDGDLDMFLLNHAVTQLHGFNIGDVRDRRDKYAGNKLFRNDNNYFTDISAEAGIFGTPSNFGLGIAIGDINNDTWPDIFVTNDYNEQDFLYLNNRNGTFNQILQYAFGHTSNFSMGCDMADINNDGKLDLLVMDMLPEDPERQKTLKGPTKFDAYQMAADYGYFYQHMHNTLQINNGDTTFSEIAWSAGVAATDWSWAPLIADYDLDGYQDVYITNGFRRDFTNLDFLKYTYSDAEQKAFEEGKKVNTLELVYQMPDVPLSNYCFQGNSQLTFNQVTKAWGLEIPSYSNGAAYADLDNDGDLDIVVSNIDDTVFVFENHAAERNHANYLKIKIKGADKNTFGIGTKVVIKANGQTIIRELATTRGFQSSVEPSLFFGLGDVNTVDLSVFYPSGNYMEYKDMAVNKELVLRDELYSLDISVSKNEPYFNDVTANTLNYVVSEEAATDFKKEPLIPYMCSDLGPALAVGDVNGDGMQDIFIGGGKNKKGRLFLADEGGYIPSFGGPWERDSAYEDVDALWVDIDKDADMDLIVISGGNEYPEGSRYYQNRLYINLSNGRFSDGTNRLPVDYHARSIVRANDFDNDGDQDLFIGGSVVPGSYPLATSSQLLQNDNGVFKDVTSQYCPDLFSSGIIRDAIWTDINGDNKDDLIIAGHWSPIRIFIAGKNKFTDATSAYKLDKTNGWWNALRVADIDNDGDMDIIAGNRGTNHPLQASMNTPAHVYACDFDHNGTIDPIITTYDKNGKEIPIASRDDITDQIPMLKSTFVYYRDYAKADLRSLFPSVNFDTVPQLSAYEFSSCVFRNEGGYFIKEILPAEAQWYPVYSILVKDVNRDNLLDIMLAGNQYGTRPELTRMDAGKGTFLLNDGSNHFVVKSPVESGFNINGEVRNMATTKLFRSNLIIVAKRNSPVQVLEIR